ncbi:MAG: hypothetical protein V3S55_06260 [Nitrospiraceae bacterium]
MSVDFTKNDIAGDIAKGLRAEQGDGYQNKIQYEILGHFGGSLTASANWFDCKNLLGIYEWLGLVSLYGPAFANRSLARLGFKLVPLEGTAQVDATALKADIDRTIEKLTGVSHEIGRAIEHGGGDAKKDAA